MKVAIVVNTSWNIFNFRAGIIKALLAKGAEVIAIAPEDKYSAVLKEWGCNYLPVEIENKGSNPWSDLKFLFRLYFLYKKTQPDIILHFTIKPNIYGTLAARMASIPVINNVSGLGTVFLHKNSTAFIAKKLYRFAFRFPKKVFFQNREDLQLFVEQKLIQKSKAGLVPGSGVDTIKFNTVSINLKNQEFTFLMVARLLYDKGIIEYIEAIKIIKRKGLKARFQIVGAIDESANLGVSMSTLQEWISEGLIEYFPFTDHLVALYHQADCVVLPSYREGTPRSLLEGASSGKPLIATDVPGCREVVVDNKNGFLCKVKDEKDLADKMEKILTLPREKYLKMANAAREHVLETFDEKIVINTYFTAINSILSG